MLADSRGSELVVLLTQRKKGETRLNELPIDRATGESELAQHARSALYDLQQSSFDQPSLNSDHEPTDDDVENALAESIIPFHLPSRLFQLVGKNWPADLSRFVNDLRPTLVVVPAPSIFRDHNAPEEWQTSLLDSVDCDVILMRDDAVAVTGQLSFAVFLHDRADNETALKFQPVLLRDLVAEQRPFISNRPSVMKRIRWSPTGRRRS